EPVTIIFPPTFPRRGPKFYARRDFDRSLAHVQPGRTDGPVQPCIADIDITELFHQGGMPVLIEHLVAWFENAALERLINPDQGWEPVRRDTLIDMVIADVDYIRS